MECCLYACPGSKYRRRGRKEREGEWWFELDQQHSSCVYIELSYTHWGLYCVWRTAPWMRDCISLSRKWNKRICLFIVTTLHLTRFIHLICSVFNICSAFCSEWHEVDYTKPSPCSSPLFPLRASRWACFQLQTQTGEVVYTEYNRTGKQINSLASGCFIESIMNYSWCRLSLPHYHPDKDGNIILCLRRETTNESQSVLTFD